MRDFFIGISYLPKGFRLLWAPGLKRYVIVPILVNVVVFLLLFWLGIEQFANLLDSLLPDPSRWNGEGFINTIMRFLVTAAYWLLWPVFVIASALVMFYTFTLVANLIGSPFNGMLAAKVEQMVTQGRSPPDLQDHSIAKEIVLSVVTEVHKYAYFALLAVPLLILFLVPGLNIIASVLWVAFGAWAIAVEYLDYAMANHGLRFREERDIIRRRRALALGLGFAILAMTLIPFLNLLAMPTGVISAALLWAERWPEEDKH